jgi:hypothetical protein
VLGVATNQKLIALRDTCCDRNTLAGAHFILPFGALFAALIVPALLGWSDLKDLLRHIVQWSASGKTCLRKNSIVYIKNKERSRIEA